MDVKDAFVKNLSWGMAPVYAGVTNNPALAVSRRCLQIATTKDPELVKHVWNAFFG